MSLNRRKEREIAFQMLFAAQFSPEADSETLYEDFMGECEEEGARDSLYIRTTFFGVREYTPEAKELIEKAAVGWKLERISKATLTILLLALYEMNRSGDVPVKIAINEAVELAKKFDEDKAPKFVNGVLGALAGTEK